MKQAVFVMSMKSSFVKRRRAKDPNFPNLRIAVRDAEKFQEALHTEYLSQAKLLGFQNPKRFKRILNSEPIEYFNDLGEAYKYAYNLLDEMNKARRKVVLHGDKSTDEYSVYCFKLQQEVWVDNKFRKANSALIREKSIPSEIPAYYVGQTGKYIEQRFNEHRDFKSTKSSKWGKVYFLDSFRNAFDSEVINRFEVETGKSTTGLKKGHSIIIEHMLTAWLKEQGYGGYCA